MDFALHHIGDDAREAGHHAATAQQVHTDIMDFRLSDIQHRISANLALPSRDTVESRMSTTRPSLVGDVTGTLRDVLCGNTSAQCEDVTGTLRNVLRGSKPALSRAPGTCQKAFPQAPAGSPGIAKRPIVGALTLDQGTSGEGPVCADASPANVHALEQCVDARALQMFRKVHLVDPPFGWVTVETTLIDGAPVTVTERTPGSVFLQRNSAENPRQVHTTLCSARNRDSTPVPPTSPIDVQITEDSSHLPTHASLAPSRPFSLMREKTKVQLNPRPVTEATVSVVPKSCPRPHTDGTMKPARTHGLKVKKWFGHAVLGDHYGSDASLLEKAENGKHGIRRADVFLETLDELQKAYTLAADRNTQESSYADASPGQACVDSDQAFQQSALSSRVRLDQLHQGDLRHRTCPQTLIKDTEARHFQHRSHSNGTAENDRSQSPECTRPHSPRAMEDYWPQSPTDARLRSCGTREDNRPLNSTGVRLHNRGSIDYKRPLSRERVRPHSRGVMGQSRPQSRECARPRSRGAMSAPAIGVAPGLRPASTEKQRKRKVAGFTASQLVPCGKTHVTVLKEPSFVNSPKNEISAPVSWWGRPVPKQGSIRSAKWHKTVRNAQAVSTNEHLPMTISSFHANQFAVRKVL